MKEILKKIGSKLKDIVCTIFAWILMVILFPYILVCAIIDAIKEKKLHLIGWNIHDAYQDFVDLPIILICFALVITIPLAIHMIDERKADREARTVEWEAKHPGKKA